MPSSDRRGFLTAASALGLSAVTCRRVLGAGERVGVGIIGYGLIGKRHASTFASKKAIGLAGARAEFADDLRHNVEVADVRLRRVLGEIDRHAEQHDLTLPPATKPPAPVRIGAPVRTLDLRRRGE